MRELHSELDELSERMKNLLEQTGADMSAGGRLDRRVREVLASRAAGDYTDALEQMSADDAWQYIQERQAEVGGGTPMSRPGEESETAMFSDVADADLRLGLHQWFRATQRGDQHAANGLYEVMLARHGIDAVNAAIRGGAR